MVRMKIAGGCGENGRSCFFVDAGRPGAGFLVDCGVSQDGGFPPPGETYTGGKNSL